MKAATVLFLMLPVVAAGCGATEPEGVAAAEPIPVSLGRVQMTEVASSFEAGGVIRARTTAVVASRILAPVVDVHVRAGDRVRRGTALVTLDGGELAARRASAAAALTSAAQAAHAAAAEVQAAAAAAALAAATHERVRTLHDKRSATAHELDEAVMARDATQASLIGARARSASATAAMEAGKAEADAARVAAGYAVLTSPFDGVITERSVDPGSMAAPGAPLLMVEDVSAFRLEIRMDEGRAASISKGQTAEVLTGGEDGQPALAARVGEIGRVDPAAHSFVVKLDLPPGTSLRSGMFGRARFAGRARPALVAPADAIVRRGQLTFVFAADAEGRARLQPVSAGPRHGDRLEILAGLSAGDRVIVDPPPMLSDGVRIREGQR